MEGEETMDIMKTRKEDIISLVVASMHATIVGGGSIPYITIPKDYKLENLESLLDNPTRKRANISVTDSDSFIQYAKEHGSLTSCHLYADVKTEESVFRIVGIIDDHSADVPAWREHQAHFEPVLSVEWKRWTQKNKAVLSQSDFAVWLEDNLSDIAEVQNMPKGAEILQMALNFERTADKRFRSKMSLQSGGVSFEYVDDDEKETKIRMDVYQRFTLGIPVFDGSLNAYPVEARLKYREKDGRIVFWYELIRPDRVFKTAVADELKHIKEATGFPIIYGKAS